MLIGLACEAISKRPASTHICVGRRFLSPERFVYASGRNDRGPLILARRQHVETAFGISAKNQKRVKDKIIPFWEGRSVTAFSQRFRKTGWIAPPG
ncbi:hypothetical protein DSCA_45920 [Desulfosarcina alkanivorans]|uniref:Uncharacterized protein n=1 Tax=Desulfosarcina alkanivorans TaxID=571177 RepID=A0A5K7YLP6_9BACT|nr:hypothetical protein DSCA_45920 [Desulfosarcina alkanivorans]